MDEQKRIGRHRNRAEADQLAAEYVASGLTCQEFCNRKGVPMKTLARYVARYRRENACEGNVQRWVAVEVAEQRGPGEELAVVLRSGRRVEVKRGFDAETLRRLVIELERV